MRATFRVFAEKLAAEGFAFLDTRIREHGGTGPVLTCQRDGRIAGAIGPMEIMPDSHGAARLLPQYFGVLPEYRGLGLGRCLWRAAMRWGQQHQAPICVALRSPAMLGRAALNRAFWAVTAGA